MRKQAIEISEKVSTKIRTPCPACGRGFLIWCEDGVIRCATCGYRRPSYPIEGV
jgi:uncharacterized Zn finger protein (UPF0148 family)